MKVHLEQTTTKQGTYIYVCEYECEYMNVICAYVDTYNISDLDTNTKQRLNKRKMWVTHYVYE